MSGAKRECEHARVRHEHGTRAAYAEDHCRCFRCRVAHADSERAYRHGESWRRDGRLVAAVGTRRRLQALAAIGIGTTELGQRLGVSAGAVGKLRSAQGMVQTLKAQQVRALYEELWDDPRSGTHTAKVMRTYASRAGWLPPMAWDDDTIDDPDGDPGYPRFRRRPAEQIAPCGTHAAHNRHKQRGERVDDQCRAAEKTYQAERWQRDKHRYAARRTAA